MAARFTPVYDILAKRGIFLDDVCSVCQDHDESFKNILSFCPFVKSVWRFARFEFPFDDFVNVSDADFCDTLILYACSVDRVEELMAISDGLFLAEAYGLDDVIIESDSLVAIQEIQNHNYNGLWFSVVANIRFLINSFRTVSFEFTYRENNFFAHKLAHFDIRDVNVKVWVDLLPPNFCNPDI
ncbi:hypothetical protein PTKIN_Ptkin19aG0034500 [Pterospermum kingtungense]